MNRNRAIDYEKGIIVAAMVLCHVMQFYGNTGSYPEQRWIILVICAMAFPTFLFAYGRSVYLAYYRRDFRSAAPRMLGSAARSYGAFCLSGVAYNLICAGKTFSATTVKKVFLLKDIPGMSEFLAAFAVLGLVALALFPALKWLLERPAAYWAVTLACFAGAFIPYEAVRDVRLGLLIGSTKFYLFPVLQYLPFFLAGLYAGRHGMKRPVVWLAVCAVLTGGGVVRFILRGEPGRFPPELGWLVLPCLGIALLDLLACALDGWTQQHAWAARALAPVESLGRNSLYYLVSSNLVLFSAGKLGLIPVYRKRSFPFSLAMNSTPWALFWTLILLLGIAFTAGLVRRASRR